MEVENILENLETILNVLDYSLDSKRKQHIAGGILLSISMLFGGLSITIMTIRTEENANEQYD